MFTYGRFLQKTDNQIFSEDCLPVFATKPPIFTHLKARPSESWPAVRAAYTEVAVGIESINQRRKTDLEAACCSIPRLARALADLALDLSYRSDIYGEFFFPVYH